VFFLLRASATNGLDQFFYFLELGQLWSDVLVMALALEDDPFKSEVGHVE